ncbi:MAG: proline racemase family protein [Planctomycetaceae bacterium]
MTALGSPLPVRLRVIDSHTIGEPTRVVVDPALAAALGLGVGTVRGRRDAFRDRHDAVRRALVGDPRGADAMVGVILVPPADPTCRFGAFYFNRVGYLDMCGHATIGLAVTLGATNAIMPGAFRVETPAGVVGVHWHGGGEASFDNVPPRRILRGLEVTATDGTRVTGDVAACGLWFFICRDHGLPVTAAEIPRLSDRAWAIRRALEARGITGDRGEVIDHIVLLGPPADPANHGRAFVLCPDGAFDRSPCGTGTSALVGNLHEDGLLAENATWRQESVLGGVYEASVRRAGDVLVPTVRGRAWITADSELRFDLDDPYRTGLER